MPTGTKTYKMKLLHSDRFVAEINLAYEMSTGLAYKTKSELSYATDAVVHCHVGNPALWRNHVYACRGEVHDKWFKKSTIVGTTVEKMKTCCESATQRGPGCPEQNSKEQQFSEDQKWDFRLVSLVERTVLLAHQTTDRGLCAGVSAASLGL